jgi:hypothetical protein
VRPDCPAISNGAAHPARDGKTCVARCSAARIGGCVKERDNSGFLLSISYSGFARVWRCADYPRVTTKEPPVAFTLVVDDEAKAIVIFTHCLRAHPFGYAIQKRQQVPSTFEGWKSAPEASLTRPARGFLRRCECTSNALTWRNPSVELRIRQLWHSVVTLTSLWCNAFSMRPAE